MITDIMFNIILNSIHQNLLDDTFHLCHKEYEWSNLPCLDLAIYIHYLHHPLNSKHGVV